MTKNALDLFVERTRAGFGPLSSELVARCRADLVQLTKTPATESWLRALYEQGPPAQELYRDPTHGFVLLAHTEQAGLYRAPHDHGRSWVIYALARGEIATSTYARVETAGGVRLVKRDESRLRAGEAQLFLPGDIHDTRCVAGPTLMFRFTERDLKQEDQVAGRLTRYVERDGAWTVPA